MTRYPKAAGFKEDTTSRDAAIAIEASGRAPTIRDRLHSLFLSGWIGTVEDAVEVLHVGYRSVQPRFSELHAQGVIEHHKQVMGPYRVDIWQWRLKRPTVPVQQELFQ